MANRDPKNVKRFIENISKEAAKIVYEGGGSGGGTIVVNELPETGKEHTIYELHQNAPASYNWVAHTPLALEDDGFSISMISGSTFIFDTYEQMTSVFENITQHKESLAYYFAYIRNEDKLYTMQSNGENWSFEEIGKLSAYTFGRPDIEEGNIYVLKSYEGYDKATDKYYVTLYNDTKVELSSRDRCFILTQVVDYGLMNHAFLMDNLYPVTTLPTAQEAVENYLDELVANNGFITVEINGVVKNNSVDNKIYHWEGKPARPETIYNFWYYVEEGDEPVYTGPLEWEDIPDVELLDAIPYQEIIDEETSSWAFKPSKGGEIITSYWIYSNGEWVNIDDISNYTTNQIFVYTTGNYINRPDRTITLVEMNMDLEEPVVISEVPYKIIDKEHIIFYNVPYNKTLYLCIDKDLLNIPNTEANSYDFEVSYYDVMGNKNYYSFNIGTIGGSIKVSGVLE